MLRNIVKCIYKEGHDLYSGATSQRRAAGVNVLRSTSLPTFGDEVNLLLIVRQRQRADGRAGGREGVQRRQRAGAPHLHHARVAAAHQVLAAPGQRQALRLLIISIALLLETLETASTRD